MKYRHALADALAKIDALGLCDPATTESLRALATELKNLKPLGRLEPCPECGGEIKLCKGPEPPKRTAQCTHCSFQKMLAGDFIDQWVDEWNEYAKSKV